jgi:hypothetical protein
VTEGARGSRRSHLVQRTVRTGQSSTFRDLREGGIRTPGLAAPDLVRICCPVILGTGCFVVFCQGARFLSLRWGGAWIVFSEHPVDLSDRAENCAF